MRGVPQSARGEEGQGNEGDPAEQNALAEEDHRHDDQRQHRQGALLNAIDEDALHGIHVLNHPGHQIPRSPLVEIADGEALQAGINVPAHVENDVLFEGVVDANAEAIEKVPEEKGSHQRERQPREFPGGPVTADAINHRANQVGVNEGEGQGKQGAEERAHGHAGVRAEVNGDAAEDFGGGALAGGQGRVPGGGRRCGRGGRGRRGGWAGRWFHSIRLRAGSAGRKVAQRGRGRHGGFFTAVWSGSRGNRESKNPPGNGGLCGGKG